MGYAVSSIVFLKLSTNGRPPGKNGRMERCATVVDASVNRCDEHSMFVAVDAHWIARRAERAALLWRVRDRLTFIVIVVVVVIVVGARTQCRGSGARRAALVDLRRYCWLRAVPVSWGVAADAGARLRLHLRLRRRRDPGVPVVLCGERRRVHEIRHGEMQLLELLRRYLATDCQALINYAPESSSTSAQLCHSITISFSSIGIISSG